MKTRIETLIVAMLWLVLPAMVRAQFIYTTNNNTIAITGYTGSDSVVVIPDTIDGLPVTDLGNFAFEQNQMTSVAIPNSVTSIGLGAFLDCANLTSVTIGTSVTNVGEIAFHGCHNLTGATIPDSVITIGSQAFYDSGLLSVTVGSGITNFERSSFGDILGSVLTNITVGANNLVYSSIDGVLCDKAQTTLVQYPVARSGSYVVPNTVTNIGELAFYQCIYLTGVTVPDSVTSIAADAFHESGLLTVTIGSGVTNFDTSYFGNNLTDIIVDAGNPIYSSLDGVLFNKDQTTLIECPVARSGSYVIPNTVVSIGSMAFEDRRNLTSVTIPTSVISIGDYAFQDCFALTSVAIPNSVTSVGDYAFYSCYGLTNVTIGNSVTNIGESAFALCSITSLVIPDSITSVKPSSFAGSLTSVTIGSGITNLELSSFGNLLTNITVAAANPVYSSIDGVLFDKAQTMLLQCPIARGGDYVIPNSVITIGDSALQGCFGLTSVTIPNSVITVGSNAFYGCDGLTGVTVGNHVASIGATAFFGCHKLAGITIPNSVTNIGHQAFGECYLLKSVNFLGNVLPDTDAFSYYTIIGYNFGKPIFGLTLDNTTIYYRPGATGWGAAFGGEPAILWNPQAQASGVADGQFAFGITGPSNAVVVVEACVNLSDPVWIPISTNTLSSGGASAFSDPRSSNFSNRFYRFRSP